MSCRTIQGRFLLKPGKLLNLIIIGILARAQELYAVRIHVGTFLSNHYHLLLSVRDASELSKFMCYVNGNLAREAGRLHGWSGPFWARRYDMIPVSDEPEAQIARLCYILAQGCKEGLVATPADWPGVQMARALGRGRALRGVWIDRSGWARARAAGSSKGARAFTQTLALPLAPLPCWEHEDEATRQRSVRELLREIRRAAEQEHHRRGTRPLGAAAVLASSPLDRPAEAPSRPIVRFHAASRRARDGLMASLRAFTVAYREAADRLKRGEPAHFPEGCFPPRLPFVPYTTAG